MRLLLFRSLWTNDFDLDAALGDCREGNFDGVEGPVPADDAARREFAARLAGSGVPFIAEVVTGGGYVPAEAGLERHLEDFRRQAEAAMQCSPIFFTVLGGCDSWPAAQSVDFLPRYSMIGRPMWLTLGVGAAVAIRGPPWLQILL